MPTSEQIRAQSTAAYNQWCVQWRKQAKEHSSLKMHSFDDLENTGVGRAILLIANGYSFEENIGIIREHQKSCDIMVCDKTLGHCLDNGIKPTYCLVCDANVSYERYLEPWKDQVSDIIFIQNVTGNPRWSFEAKWQKRYFYVNEDILKSEKEFIELSGCKNTLPAGTNVSNTMVIALTQSDNNGRNNFFGYDKILLIGFDYCWSLKKKYYAFNDQGDGKIFYMSHVYSETRHGEAVCSSGNLMFSCQWLEKYIASFRLPVIQCSDRTLLLAAKPGVLSEQMQYNFRSSDSGLVRAMIEERNTAATRVGVLENKLKKIGREHFYNYLATT